MYIMYIFEIMIPTKSKSVGGVAELEQSFGVAVARVGTTLTPTEAGAEFEVFEELWKLQKWLSST